MIFKNGQESIDVNVIKDFNDGTYEITYEESVRILRQNKFNDDKFGSIVASYEGPDDEDPYWLYIEDTTNDEDFEMYEDYKYFYLVPATERGTEKITESNMEDNNKDNKSREEKIQTLRDNTKFDEEQLKQMTDVDLNKMWDEMEGTDWMNNVDVESEHGAKLEKRGNLLSFEKFNEEAGQGHGGIKQFSNDSGEYPVTIQLELKINKNTVEDVQFYLDQFNLTCTPAEALHQYFLYNTGYHQDATYGELMGNWIYDNKEDL
tara:strand:+ start:888 stop:1673 length:786 start_codon:yes stop_codon:yes gene_type:complete